MDCSTPGFSVHHQLPELTQTHVHRVGDGIQPSHPLSFPSPFSLNLSQHQGLFQEVSSSHQVANVLQFQLQHLSLQRNPRADLLQNGLVGSPCSPRDSQESTPTPQFKSINSRCSAFFTVQLSHPYMTTGLKFKFSGGSQSLCWISRSGNLLWALELSQQCENVFSIILLQSLGHLLSGFMVEIMAASSKRFYATHRATEVCCSQSSCPCGSLCCPAPPQETLRRSKAGLA